jgi:hypothetical protein
LHYAKDDYVALSYVWGDATNATRILCNGKPVRVTLNLAKALQGLRNHTTTMRLWADAICIDQRNNEEKNQQVTRMGTIYTLAKHVIVWLGRDEDGIAYDCFDLISSTNTYLDRQLVTYGAWSKIPTLVKPYPICDSQSRWNNVRKMLSLPWFTRVWVIQEASLAKRCTLRWGESELDFAHVMELALWQLHREDVSEVTGTLGLFRLMNQFRSIYSTYDNPITWRKNLPLIRNDDNSGEVFADLLYAASGMCAKDKRDHIFAFLGSRLALRTDGQLLVKPDYNKELRDVYFEAACSFLWHPREAPFVLSRVKHFSQESLHDPDIPTWVPRWDRTPEFTISRHYFWFRAGGNQANFNPVIREDRSLAVQGIIIGSIAYASRVIRKHNIGTDPSTWEEEYRLARKPFIDVLLDETLNAMSPPSATNEFEKEFAWTLAREFPHMPGKACDAQYMMEFEAYRNLVRAAARSYRGATLLPARGCDAEFYPRDFTGRFYNYCNDLRIAILDSGRLSLVPSVAQLGDFLCVIVGIPVPMTLRHVKDRIHKLVGESYVRGAMAGEVLESGSVEGHSLRKETIVLI